MPRIPKEEFVERIEKLREKMAEERLDAYVVYGDEYRKENLRYVSNYWPIFERAALFIPREGEPILVGAPECEEVAREMSAWSDIRNTQDFTCVTVPEEIDYPQAEFTSFSEIAKELAAKGKLSRLGVVGLDAMSTTIYSSLREAFQNVELVDASHLLTALRLIKSPNEIACLREAWRIADIGYAVLMAGAVPGNTELVAVGAAENAARKAGAEDIVFTILGSGHRTNTIVGRPTTKLIEEGEMIMTAFAVQYEGYVSTVEFPFVAGNVVSEDQKLLIDALVEAEERSLELLGPEVRGKDFVRAVKSVFAERGLSEYDLYPPLHGCGLAEAESPYPDEKSEMVFQPGMTVNTDISLFGHPAGSNRIEEGFVITASGAEPLSQLVGKLRANWLSGV